MISYLPCLFWAEIQRNLQTPFHAICHAFSFPPKRPSLPQGVAQRPIIVFDRDHQESKPGGVHRSGKSDPFWIQELKSLCWS
jgi:hypothetical protein